jgi:hypothetical protein
MWADGKLDRKFNVEMKFSKYVNLLNLQQNLWESEIVLSGNMFLKFDFLSYVRFTNQMQKY